MQYPWSKSPELAGKPYRPCNGSEGSVFDAWFCGRCVHDWKGRESGVGGCMILCGMLGYDKADPKYPKELVHDAEGGPTCTAFMAITESESR